MQDIGVTATRHTWQPISHLCQLGLQANAFRFDCKPTITKTFLLLSRHDSRSLSCNITLHYYIRENGQQKKMTMIRAVNLWFFPKGPKIASDKLAFHFFTHQKSISTSLVLHITMSNHRNAAVIQTTGTWHHLRWFASITFYILIEKRCISRSKSQTCTNAVFPDPTVGRLLCTTTRPTVGSLT